jgi:hypothetical protein
VEEVSKLSYKWYPCCTELSVHCVSCTDEMV